MPGAKRDYHITPAASGDGWSVKREGASRATAHFATKGEAMRRGRELAASAKVELVEHGRDGRIAGRDSHGNDPRRSKG